MKQVKILFVLGDDGWDGSYAETVWAIPCKNGFIIDNTPFFKAGICREDVVRGRWISKGMYEYVETMKKSTNSVYRILYKKTHSEEADLLLKKLVALGCIYENLFTIRPGPRKCPFGRSAALRCLPIATAMGKHRALHPIPNGHLRDSRPDRKQVLREMTSATLFSSRYIFRRKPALMRFWAPLSRVSMKIYGLRKKAMIVIPGCRIKA